MSIPRPTNGFGIAKKHDRLYRHISRNITRGKIMSQLPTFRFNGQTGLGTLERSTGDLPSLPVQPTKSHLRTKIWELSTNLHCSIIGTCLTGAELRQFLRKMGDGDARAATDHTVHTIGVLLAGRQDAAGKNLNKMLDRRHERLIRHFAKAKHPRTSDSSGAIALPKARYPGPIGRC